MAWIPGRHDRHLPPNWSTVRQQVLRRDGFECSFCSNRATDVDHIGSRNNHRLDNLRALCSECHRKRTSKQGSQSWHAAMRASKAKLRRPTEPHPGLTSH